MVGHSLETFRAMRKWSVGSDFQEKQSVLFILLLTRKGQDSWDVLWLDLVRVNNKNIC